MQKRALTVKGNGRLPAIISEAGISIPFLGDPSKQKDLVIKSFKGIWDTGATNSVITKEVVDVLQLQPTGQTEVHTAKGVHTTNTYLVNISLPGDVMIQHVRVTEAELAQGVNVLIGMDIITMGDFSITNHNGKTTMSFRVPSCAEIDYVKEVNKENEEAILANMNRHERRAYEAKKRKGQL